RYEDGMRRPPRVTQDFGFQRFDDPVARVAAPSSVFVPLVRLPSQNDNRTKENHEFHNFPHHERPRPSL
ncbi:MAG: hypothetical protein ACREF9_11780, partial [Opitutaceae bacterium]